MGTLSGPVSSIRSSSILMTFTGFGFGAIPNSGGIGVAMITKKKHLALDGTNISLRIEIVEITSAIKGNIKQILLDSVISNGNTVC